MSSKRVDFYETYYKNVSPSTFKVKKEDDKIVIEDINKKYPKNFKPKDVKQYPVNQEAFKKGGKVVVKNDRLIVDGKDVGLFEYTKKGNVIEIERLYIDSDKRRNGYGKLAVPYIFDSYPNINTIEVYAGGNSSPFWLKQGVSSVGKDGVYKISREFYENPKLRYFKKGGQTKSWKNKYNKKYGYPANESHSIKEISKDTGVSVKGLKAIYKKGVGARKTNPQSVRSVSDGKKRGGKSLRGKMGAQQWAMARIYSAVMGGKAAKVDKKELKMKKGGALQKPKNEYGVMFNKGYDNVRLEFFIFKNKNTYIDGENIGYADSKLYLDDINVLNLYEFTLFPQYDTEEARREIIYFIKDKMKMHTGKNKLMINNTIQ